MRALAATPVVSRIRRIVTAPLTIGVVITLCLVLAGGALIAANQQYALARLARQTTTRVLKETEALRDQLRAAVARVQAQTRRLSADSVTLARAVADARRPFPRPLAPSVVDGMVPETAYVSLSRWSDERHRRDSVALGVALASVALRDTLLDLRAADLIAASLAADSVPGKILSAVAAARADEARKHRCRMLYFVPCPSRRVVFVAGTALGAGAVAVVRSVVPH
jgi:hypothetical protein